MLYVINDTATAEIYTLALLDALPVWRQRDPGVPGQDRLRVDGRPLRLPAHRHRHRCPRGPAGARARRAEQPVGPGADRKSTRLNSSHANISYAVFCFKKLNNNTSNVF